MALYKVTRTDEPGPGEFVDATVIAGGTAQARKAVAHLPGVTAKNVVAVPVSTTGRTEIVSVYYDERTSSDFPVSDYDNEPYNF